MPWWYDVVMWDVDVAVAPFAAVLVAAVLGAVEIDRRVWRRA